MHTAPFPVYLVRVGGSRPMTVGNGASGNIPKPHSNCPPLVMTYPVRGPNPSSYGAVVKLHVLLTAKAVPTRSVTPVVIVAVKTVLGARSLRIRHSL